ncbi:hypothetical protein RIF29_32776 [Crotalaria pallida]|uniref:Uncharacterized protein n=1 Tax=Crotalaria pallida TaxID=3830 RepID=A0AAN9EJ52_CROPI
MDPKQSSSSSSSSPTRRKMKYKPTAPQRNSNRKPKQPPLPLPPSQPSPDIDDEGDDDKDKQHFLSRSWKNLGRPERGKPKVERKSSVQVAVGPGDSSPPNLRSRSKGVSNGINSGKNSGSASQDNAPEQNNLERSLAIVKDQTDTCMIDANDDTTNSSAVKIRKEYKEPWDYEHSHYPTTLPLRKPHSGDPETLDEEEFGEAASNVEYDERTINPAAEFAISEKNEEPCMFLFQLPPMPLVKQSVIKKGKEKEGASRISGESTKGSPWKELPGGYMGKMLVYKSGAVKLKLGESMFDVSPGSKSEFPQDFVAMNTAQKHCCVIGEISKRAVVTPDLDSVEKRHWVADLYLFWFGAEEEHGKIAC